MQAKQVAETIMQQLYAGGRNKVWSWGANSWSFGTMPKVENKGGESFLIFKVQGFLFKGLVRIILEWNDTYTVQLLKKEKGELVLKDKVEDVYCDELTDVIDRKVEFCGNKEKYEQQVNKAVYKI